MKILIVYRDCSLQEALTYQFNQRGYDVLCICAEEAAELLQGRFAEALGQGDDDSDGVVIDAASCASDRHGTALDDASFRGLVDWCAQRRWQFALLSDSRVFPGGKPGRGQQRYREIDATQPSTAAGAELVERERYLAAHWERHVILRTGPLIAATGDNLLTGSLQQLRGGGALAGAQDVRFAPTPSADLARVLVAMCDQLACNAMCWGVYHYHSSDPATGYEFAEVVLAAAAQYWALEAGHPLLQTSIADPLTGLYPLLNCQRIRDTFGIQQLPWRKAIPQLLKTIHAGETS